MACSWIKLEDGTVVHINMGRTRAKRCKFCNRGEVTKLCDSPVGTKTCDAGMCDACATQIARDIDYCPKCEAARKSYVRAHQRRLEFTR